MSIVQVCSKLDGLVEKQNSATDDIVSSVLQQEVQRMDADICIRNDKIHKMQALIQSKDAQIQRQATEIEALKSGMVKLLKSHDTPLVKVCIALPSSLLHS